MLVCGDQRRDIEVVEQSAATSFESKHHFTAEEVVSIVELFKRSTFQCPICRKIIFPDIGINPAGELYTVHDEIFAYGARGAVKEFLPAKSCKDCKTKFDNMAKKLNQILSKADD